MRRQDYQLQQHESGFVGGDGALLPQVLHAGGGGGGVEQPDSRILGLPLPPVSRTAVQVCRQLLVSRQQDDRPEKQPNPSAGGGRPLRSRPDPALPADAAVCPLPRGRNHHRVHHGWRDQDGEQRVRGARDVCVQERLLGAEHDLQPGRDVNAQLHHLPPPGARGHCARQPRQPHRLAGAPRLLQGTRTLSVEPSLHTANGKSLPTCPGHPG